jgi:hypothetical protein
MNANSKQAFWEENVEGLSHAKESDDYLHPELSKLEPGYQLTETQYLGFNIPEHNIHGLGYLWYHPNLKTVTGGIAVWQGFKRHPLESEIWDYVTYMSDECLKDNLHHYQLENSYEVTVIKPLTSHRIQYESKATDSWVDVTLEALTPPIMLGTGMHFEQPMKTSGEIRLRGRNYNVNAKTVRDRSFGQLRKEYIVPLPPLAWMNAAFSENFAFGCTAFDDPSSGPEWAGKFNLPNNNPLRGGWLYKDGIPSVIVKASKVTVRKPGTFYPDRVELTITDARGRTLEIVGTSLAGVMWQTWHNMDSDVTLMRWEADGQVTHGDYQEFLWPEYIRQFHP